MEKKIVTVQDLITELNKIEDKSMMIFSNWLCQDKNHIFWINSVEDDIDSVLLNIETD